MDPKLRVIVVDDHPAVRAGVAALLSTEGDLHVVGEAGDGREAVDVFRRERPDVALMDLRLPGLSGADAIRAICHDFPDARVIVMTTYDSDEDRYRAFESGAKAYLLKDASRDEIAHTIRAVAAGQHVARAPAAAVAARACRDRLTERETEVLCLLTKGHSNKEIAAALFICEDTVKSHLKALFAKLGVQGRTEAAVAAIRHGIVALD